MPSKATAVATAPRSVQDPLTNNAVNVTGILNVLLAAREVLGELRRIVDEAITLERKDGKALPLPTSGRDFAKKVQNVA